MIGRLEDAETKKDRPTKVQSRAKAQLKSALSLAAKYDVAADATSPPAETSDEPIRGT